jgi:hypothetical protein
MKTYTKYFLSALPILFAFNLGAAELTLSDAMGGTYAGEITITTNSGKQVKGHGSVCFRTGRCDVRQGLVLEGGCERSGDSASA